MRVYVNEIAVELLPGMTVRHAITAAYGVLPDPWRLSVSDPWGNRLGLDGALSNNERIRTVETDMGNGHG